jgi:hypothetical protein
LGQLSGWVHSSLGPRDAVQVPQVVCTFPQKELMPKVCFLLLFCAVSSGGAPPPLPSTPFFIFTCYQQKGGIILFLHAAASAHPPPAMATNHSGLTFPPKLISVIPLPEKESLHAFSGQGSKGYLCVPWVQARLEKDRNRDQMSPAHGFRSQ